MDIMRLTTLQSAMYSLIWEYVDRQQIALQALNQLRPDLIFFSHRTAADDENEDEAFLQEFIRLNRLYTNVPYNGEWEEWEYVIHGMGIRLIHTVTKQPIEWDAPNVLCFDRYWLVNYLEWYTAFDVEDEALRIIHDAYRNYQGRFRDFTFDIIDQLQRIGVLLRPKSDNWNKFVIVSADDYF
jgi:hypothetical protein